MKITLQRNVHGKVDILLDKYISDNTEAEKFFHQVHKNLLKKEFVLMDWFKEYGRTFRKYSLRGKAYILGVY